MPKQSSPTAEDDHTESPVEAVESAPNSTAVNATTESKDTKLPPWHEFIRTASHTQIKERYAAEATSIIESRDLSKYCILGLLEPDNSIDGAQCCPN